MQTVTTVGLDIESRRALWHQIRTLAAQGKTILFTTHYLEEADALANRIIVINKGRVISEGPPAEIKAAQDVDVSTLRDPEPDSKRVQKPEWLVVVGVCTHLGCIPLGQKTGDDRGPFGGWFCPCHGSVYDTSARIRQGPAPLNLWLPGEVDVATKALYKFTSDTTITIG